MWNQKCIFGQIQLLLDFNYVFFRLEFDLFVMAKIREISSIERGLAEAIKELKSETIQEATGKSESFLRKCSDPDLDQQLDHRDAVKIDRACVEKGLTPYLLRAHEYIILKELKNIKTEDENLSDLLIYIEPLRNFLEIIQKVPGYSIDIFIKKIPRLINEPYTKEIGFKIAKKVTEKGVVRLVKIAAGVNI